MGAIDLNRIAVCMGKVIKLLSDLQPIISNGNDVYEHKEDFCCIAYMCRVGILDRIESNSYMRNPTIPIRIPTGLFSSRKETIDSGLSLTIGKLKEIVSKDIVTASYIDDILNHRGLYYEFERSLPDSFKRGL
ncbi:hypothetical protein [Butyricimonas virosa]|jgi:hypothetical protein|uniref:hypothetical protein n=1 Tax=Butyricimonas virosa TaxID=544645 RepID=UPI00241C4CFC|nr:hypothetical protein [Butyricimonas virosa]